MIGTRVSHYHIIEGIGAGGMGVVYLAEDERLHRKVALKFLPPTTAQDAHARARLLREAQAASALDHPNVATVHDIGESNGQLFIAMPFYDGETLRTRIERGPLTFSEAARIAGQIAAGLAAAHRAGIVHRDLKPANIVLTNDGQVKIVDFGLAMVLSETRETGTRMTAAGTTLGTVAYMAPEQASGIDVDSRADVWALGVTLYEMLTGELPFPGATVPAMLLAVASKDPVPVRNVRPDAPDALVRIVERALEKEPARRAISADDVAAEIGRWQVTSSAGVLSAAAGRSSATRWWIAIAAVALLAAALPAVWFVRQNARTRRAREQALPQIDQLSEREEYAEAFAIAQQARQYIPNDPVWKRIDPIVSRQVSVQTTPPGAAVSYRKAGSGGEWVLVGASPIEKAIIPNTYLEWRFEKAGYVTASDATLNTLTLVETLHTSEQTPPGMVHVTTGEQPRVALIAGLDHLPPQRLRDFWIDRYEVTNRDFKRFVDAGGYRDRKYWRQPFVDGGRTLTFEQAMARFKDSAGRPARAGHLGVGQLCRRPGRPAGHRRKLVRSRRVRRVFRQVIAHPVSLEPSRRPAPERRGRAAQQLPRPGRRKGGLERGDEPVRRVRPGRQRQGMVLEQRERRQALHHGRRLGRAGLHVQRSRCASAVRASGQFRVPWRQVRRRRCGGEDGRTGGIRRPRLLSPTARCRRCVRGVPDAVRVRQGRPRDAC